jgi:hypothetical protein
VTEPGESVAARRAARVAEWERAEAIVSGTLQYDPATYQAAIAAVATVLGHLRAEVTDDEALVEAEFDPVVVGLARVHPTTVLAPGIIVAAAMAVRHRELSYQSELDRRRAALRRAEEAGQAWAELDDEPRAAPAGRGPGLRVHLTTGLAIMTTARFDLETGATEFVASVVGVDIGSGALTAPGIDTGGERVAPDRFGLERNVAELTVAIETVDIRPQVE